MPRDAVIPGHWDVLIGANLVNEVAERFHDNTQEPPERQQSIDRLDGLARKVMGFISHHRTRVWAAHQWHMISRGEYDPRVVIRVLHIVDAPLSAALRTTQLEFLIDKFHTASTDEAFVSYCQEKVGFIRMCREYSTFVRSHDRDALDSSGADPVGWIQQPRLLADWLRKSNSKYADSKWDSALERFPDRLAQARWARLVAWYAAKHALAPDQGDKLLGNSFDDAEYAFLASYTKHLATIDNDLCTTVRTVFPDVKIWNPGLCGWTDPQFT